MVRYASTFKRALAKVHKSRFINLNWRGKPLLTFENVINLIDKIGFQKHKTHPDWNYTLMSRNT
jgi:hypothetical protein